VLPEPQKRFALAIAAAVALLAFAAFPAFGQPRSGPRIDAFVLALSWSPSYCADEDQARRSREQCGARRPYRFIVHGLWPQSDGAPVQCPDTDERVPASLINRMMDIMPSRGLIGHQWRKHGSCSGLSQERYFFAVRAARARVSIPAALDKLSDPQMFRPNDVEAAFRSANPSLPSNAIAVTCRSEQFAEVRVCFDRRLAFSACPEVDRRACRAGRMSVPSPE
jgi:ribonuclease T2